MHEVVFVWKRAHPRHAHRAVVLGMHLDEHSAVVCEVFGDLFDAARARVRGALQFVDPFW